MTMRWPGAEVSSSLRVCLHSWKGVCRLLGECSCAGIAHTMTAECVLCDGVMWWGSICGSYACSL